MTNTSAANAVISMTTETAMLRKDISNDAVRSIAKREETFAIAAIAATIR